MSGKITVGSKVQYKAAFLRSTGMYTGKVPFAKGTVTEVLPFPGGADLVTVDWGDPTIPTKILSTNLKVIGTPEPD